LSKVILGVLLYTLRIDPLNYAWLTKIDYKTVDKHVVKKGLIQGYFRNILKPMFKIRLQDKENKTCLKILALGIYGLILFLSVEVMIDFEVVNVLQSMDTFKINDHDIFG
jgi:hypothetical protein